MFRCGDSTLEIHLFALEYALTEAVRKCKHVRCNGLLIIEVGDEANGDALLECTLQRRKAKPVCCKIVVY